MANNPRFDVVISEQEKDHPPFSGPLRGVLIGVADTGEPLVDFYGNPAGAAVAALATVPITRDDAGRQALLLFEDNNPQRPIIVGLIQRPASAPKETDKVVQVKLDGQRLTLTAEQEIVLRCGEASITLTRAGKVLIRGAYLLSRSTGVNRIKGGSVQLN